MDYSVINNGTYPEKSVWKSNTEKTIFGMMIVFSVIIYTQIAVYYVYGGQ